jgi:hypothetical protein
MWEAPEPLRRQALTLEALRQSMRFQESMRLIGRAAGASPADFARLSARVEEMAQR